MERPACLFLLTGADTGSVRRRSNSGRAAAAVCTTASGTRGWRTARGESSAFRRSSRPVGRWGSSFRSSYFGMLSGGTLRLAGGGVRGWTSGDAHLEDHPRSLKACPQTPPPGMRSIPPKCIPKPELGNEGSRGNRRLLQGFAGGVAAFMAVTRASARRSWFFVVAPTA
jgi:hypothetical protein